MNFEKIRKMLIKYGVSEEEADGFIENLKTEPNEEKPEVLEVEGETEEENPEAVDEPKEEVQPEETIEAPVDEVPAEEPVAEENPVAEEPPVVEEAPVEEQAQIPEAEPLVEEPAQDQDLKFEVEELKKANEGLCAKIDSLVESLKQAGVLTVVKESDTVGVDVSETPATPETNDAMSSFLAKANRRF